MFYPYHLLLLSTYYYLPTYIHMSIRSSKAVPLPPYALVLQEMAANFVNEANTLLACKTVILCMRLSKQMGTRKPKRPSMIL